MEQVIALILGWASVHLQGNWLKNKLSDSTRIRVRFFISLFISVLAGLLSTLPSLIQDGKLKWEDALMNIGVAFTTSQTYYNTYFRLK